MITFDKNIPIPKTRQEKGKSRAILESMEVGDSFAIQTIKEKILFEGARSTIYTTGTMKFSIKKYEGAFRCWRIQ